jgi:hypothetical protein
MNQEAEGLPEAEERRQVKRTPESAFVINIFWVLTRATRRNILEDGIFIF